MVGNISFKEHFMKKKSCLSLEEICKVIGLSPLKLPKLKSGLRGNEGIKEHYDEETEYIVKNFFID